jgi:hypothetical protein
MSCIQYTTHIERVPGERPHTVAFDAYVDGSVLGSFPTRAAAQEALDEHRYDRLLRQQPLLPDEPLSGSELATLWASDRNAALRFLAELSPGDLVVQALRHSQWLLQQHNTLIEPVEIVRRYQQAVAVFLHDQMPAHPTPLKQAA